MQNRCAKLHPLVQMEVDFGRDIRPILSRRCTQCHGSAEQEGGLDFSSRALALAELDSGERADCSGRPGSQCPLGADPSGGR